METISTQPVVAPEQIFTLALEGYLDSTRLDVIEESRELTNRETVERGIAAVKLILFGSAALATALDRLITRR